MNGYSDKTDELSDRLAKIQSKQGEEATQKKAAQLRVRYISLKDFPVAQDAIALIHKDDAVKYKVICFFAEHGEYNLATIQPEDAETKKFIEKFNIQYHGKSVIYLCSEDGFERGMKIYDRLPSIKKVDSGVTITAEEVAKYKGVMKSLDALQKNVEGANLTDLIVMIVAGGLDSEASDIHVESEEKKGIIRYRIDGVLHEVLEIPNETSSKLADRFKLVSKLKINIKDKPQDGRFTINLNDGKVEMRVSTLPTAYGESIVMRILRPDTISLKFDDLGLMGKSYERLKEQIKRPNGMIITTGPTGSGKTTTLYAILRFLNSEENKIVTLEDPIEYKLEGIAQSQVDQSRDYTFSKGLRSILRQDPDIVMVGEIRDLETADVAVQAALTGHLMLSTIHTNSAAGALPRFLSIGVKPFLLPPALNAVIGQRLARRLCKKCKQETELDAETKAKVMKIFSTLPSDAGYDFDSSNPKFYKAVGCEACMNLGYKGRVGMYEVFLMNKEVASAIDGESVSEYKIQEIAEKNGMVTMAQDGLAKAAMGLTTVEEVLSVAEQKNVTEDIGNTEQQNEKSQEDNISQN